MKTIFFLLLFWPLLGLTQKVDTSHFEVKTSAVFDVGYMSTPLYAQTDTSFLVITKSGDSIHLRLFNSTTLELLSTNAYAAFPKQTGFKGLIDLKRIRNSYFLFYFFEEPMRDYQEIYMAQVDPFSGTILGEGKKLYTLKHSDSFDKTLLDVDIENNRFLLHYQRMIKYVDDPTYYYEYNLLLFDAAGNILHGYTYVPPYSIKKIESMLANIDSRGNIHLLVNIKNKDNKKKARFDRIMIPFNSKDMMVSKEEIAFPFITIDYLQEQKEGKMLIAGLYSHASKKTFDGFLIMEIDNINSISKPFSIDIPLQTINSYSSKKVHDKNIRIENKGTQVGIENLTFRELIQNENGSYLLVAENYERLKSDVPAYRYRELLVSKITSDYQFQWCSKIPKFQSEKAAFSYQYIPFNSKHLFIYNDDPENLQIDINASPTVIKDYDKGVLAASILADEDGSIHKEIALDLRDYEDLKLNAILTTKAIFAVNEGSFIFLNTGTTGGFILFSLAPKKN